MSYALIGRIKPGSVLCFLLLPALAGCGGSGGASMSLEEALSLAAGPGLAVGALAVNPDRSAEDGNTPELSGESLLPTDTTATVTQTSLDSNLLTSQSPGTDSSDGLTATGVSTGVIVEADIAPGSRGLADLPRDNPDAEDLLDHWGHRPMDRILEGLSLTDADAEADGADLQALRTAAQAGEELEAPVLRVGDVVRIPATGQTGSNVVVAPNLFGDDEVGILGARRGITYGRWTGGPADTLSIEFDLSQAGSAIRENPLFRAMLDRAGKAWSHRIDDTWSTWRWPAGAVKGYSVDPDDSIAFRAGDAGETSTGLQIVVTDAENLGAPAVGGAGFVAPYESWQPHFGGIALHTRNVLLGDEADRYLMHVNGFYTFTHEIGHVLGSWYGRPRIERFAPYIDEATGTWTGPNVVAIHGGPASFRAISAPTTEMDADGNPPPAAQYDFAHSGVCASVMAYCSDELPSFLPHAIDFAFLADLGLTIRDETTRPETYGLAGWTEYAGFTLSVSRALSVGLADPQPFYDRWANRWSTLDVVDLLQAEADAFGYRSTGDFSLSYPGVGALGTVRYAGGLLGAALTRAGLPPVLGNANLAVNLGTLAGTASFTSLAVYPNGLAEPFAGGRLHYPFALSANTLIGTDTRSTFLADFYGPAHEEVAGTLHDPRAGLLASFGATYDDRPSREDVVVSADYLFGRSYRHGSTDPADDGWYRYRCGTNSACALRHAENGWTTTTRERVLAATAGWPGQGTERTEADYDFVRITRQSAASTDGAQGRHAVDSYTGTLEYVSFGPGLSDTGTGCLTRMAPLRTTGTRGPAFRGRCRGGLPRGWPGGRARWWGYSGIMSHPKIRS